MGWQPRILEHLLIRGFAAATVVMAVVSALFVAGLLVYVVGTLESHGLLVGRAVIEVTAVPDTVPKRQQLDGFRALAAQHDVGLALVVPDRDGLPAAVDVYTVRGSVPTPVFWADFDTFSADQIGDAAVLWTYALDGSASDTAAFLVALSAAGVDWYPSTPDATVAVGALVGAPGVTGLAGVVTVSAVIALAAEATRRAPWQRTRRIAGWSRVRIAAREGGEVVALFGTAACVSVVAIAAWLAVRGAPVAVWSFSARIAVACVVVGLLATGLCSAVLTRTCSGTVWRPARAPQVVVAICAAVLVTVMTADGFTIARVAETSTDLEQHLVDEAAHGDDVVLTTTSTSLADEIALGQIGRAAIDDGSACMAQTNLVEGALVTFPDCVPQAWKRGSDAIVLLVPDARQDAVDGLRQDVREAIKDGWELDGVTAPPELPIRVQQVASTASFVEAVTRWVIWFIEPRTDPIELPVIIMPSSGALPANRVGLAIRNAEVRFDASFPLEVELTRAGVRDVVVQVNRVGAQTDRQLAELRTERVLLSITAVGSAGGLVFAAMTMIAAHRARTRGARRLRSLVGRSVWASHRRFVSASAITAAGLGSGSTAASIGWAPGAITIVGGVIGLVVAALLTAGIALSAHRDRTTR